MRLTLLWVAAVLYGQTPPGPAGALDGARAKIRGDMQRLPKAACLPPANVN